MIIMLIHFFIFLFVLTSHKSFLLYIILKLLRWTWLFIKGKLIFLIVFIVRSCLVLYVIKVNGLHNFVLLLVTASTVLADKTNDDAWREKDKSDNGEINICVWFFACAIFFGSAVAFHVDKHSTTLQWLRTIINSFYIKTILLPII